jgi:hypothetical protein
LQTWATAGFQQAFQKFYVDRQKGRKLQWDMSKGRAEARHFVFTAPEYRSMLQGLT